MTEPSPPLPLDPRLQADVQLNTAFSPHQPIRRAAFFRGRTEHIRDVLDALKSDGLHVLIYGERGVGKTSLANIIGDIMGSVFSMSRVACGPADTFSTVIRRVMGNVQFAIPNPSIGFLSEARLQYTNLSEVALGLEDVLQPDHVAAALERVQSHLVFVIDEFDKLPAASAGDFANFLKALSDRGANVTVVLVGVAEDVAELLEGHRSVERNLRQIHLPRMDDAELGQILDEGFAQAGFSYGELSVKSQIVSVSQGFPQFTHLLGVAAARAAIDLGRHRVLTEDVRAGVSRAIEQADQSKRDLYHKASTGTKSDNKWKEVVAACALASADERGYFSSRAVQDTLGSLLNRPVMQQAVAYHLGKLIEPDRGPLLERVGQERRYRYRFTDPLMRPFIVLQAMKDGLIGEPA